MGLDLKFLPLRDREQLMARMIIADTVLSVPGDYAIFGQIANSLYTKSGLEVVVRPIILPPKTKVWIPEHEQRLKTRKDAYDHDLTYAFAEQLKGIRQTKNITPNITPRGKAALAYIKALPKDTPVILYWH